MPNTRLVDVNGSGGDYVEIKATQACRGLLIREDEGAAAQGLTYTLPGDGFTQVYTVSTPSTPDAPQIALPDPITHSHLPTGALLGLPAQGDVGAHNARTADILIKLSSTTATATKVRVMELD